MRKHIVFVAVAAVWVGLMAGEAQAAATFRSFDGPELSWQHLDPRPGAKIVSHGLTQEDARQGTGSERLTVAAPGDEAMHFACRVGRLPVLDELEARLWVKSDRPGVTLAARVVLPRTIDAKTGATKTVFLHGEQIESPGRWQQLRLSDVPALLAAQTRIVRASAHSNVDAREAFVDAIVLIVPGGESNTTVWTDALEVEGVVLPAAAETTGDPRAMPAVFAAPAMQSAPPTASPSTPVANETRFQGTTLMVGGRPFLLRAIEWNHEPFAYLAERGFNTVWLDEPATREQSAEAARAGLWLVCTPPSQNDITTIGIDAALDRVLAWHLGSTASPSELERMRSWADQLRNKDPIVGRPVIIAPRGDWLPASRIADALVADHPAAGSLSREDYCQWLASVPLVARPGTPLWASIPTQPGPRTRKQLAALAPGGKLPTTALDSRQIELLVESAATNGYRAFVFQSDSPLDASDELTQRRAVLLEKINDQLDSISPWLTIGKQIGDATSVDGTVEGIVLQAERARLLVITSRNDAATSGKTRGANVPEQLVFIVAGIPASNEAYLLSPVGLQALESKRIAGGIRIVLDREAEGSILMTEDSAVTAALRQRLARRGGRAAHLQFALANSRLRSLSSAAGQLQRLQINSKSLDQAIGAANGSLRTVSPLLASRNFEAAYNRSHSAEALLSSSLDALRGQFQAGPALSSTPFRTDAGALARQAEFETSLASLRGGENQLAGGDFEDLQQIKQLGWRHVEDPIAGIQARVQLTGRGPQEGRYCLELSALPTAAAGAPQIVAHPLVWVTSPPVRAAAGEVIEISGWVRVTQPITGSIAGLEIGDSLGGRELALRVRSTNDWQPFRLVRGTDETREMTVSFALTGIGSAAIDGVMIRTLAAPSVKRLPTVTREAGPTFPSPTFPGSARRSLFPLPLDR